MGRHLCWVFRLCVCLSYPLSLSVVADVLVGNLRRYFFVPETRGLSLEQIDRMYRESSSMFWVLFWVLSFSDLVFLASIVVASEAFNRKLLKLKENKEVADVSTPSSGSVRLFSFTFMFLHAIMLTG